MSDIEVIENVFIPLKDGTRLAARLWLPEEELRPAPAALEYIPYRKRDDEAEMRKHVDPHWKRVLPRW